MIYRYKVFELIWESYDLNFPELTQHYDLNQPVDVVIKEEKSHKWDKLSLDSQDSPFLQVRENDLRLNIEGIGKFRAFNGKKISWEKSSANVNDDDIRVFILGSIFGAILIQKNFLLLHGNAMEKKGRIIACLGPSGAGKSTLSYSLACNGWNLLADDMVSLTKSFVVKKGIPRIKLWNDAVNSFRLDQNDLKKVRRNIFKYSVKNKSNNNKTYTKQIDCIYIINRISKLSSSKDTFINGEILDFPSKNIALGALLKNLYRPSFVKALSRKKNYFTSLVSIAEKIPVYSLNLPPSINDMNQWLKYQEL